MNKASNRAMSEARAAFQAGDFTAAEKLLRPIIRSDPRNVAALTALGLIAASAGQAQLAIERMERALVVDPDCQTALIWVGLSLVKQEQFDRARPFLRKALKQDPRNLEILLALGLCNFRLKEPSTALMLFDQALEIDPNDERVQMAKCNCLRDLFRYREAADILRTMLDRKPDADGFVRLAEIDLARDQVEQAVGSCSKALSMAPNNPEAHIAAGRAMLELNRPDEAEFHWRKAHEIRPDSWETFNSIANAYNHRGEFEIGIPLLLRSIEIEPLQAQAYLSIVLSKRIDAQDSLLIDRMENAIKSSKITGSDRLQLLFALAKAHDNLGNFERAMSFYDQGNALNLRPFDREDFRRHVEAAIRVFTPQLLAKAASNGSQSEVPIFVVGMMRSGTTLTEQILSCHRQVGGAGEQLFWTEHESEIVNSVKGQVNLEVARERAEEYIRLLQTIAPGFPRVVDKYPANFFLAGLLALVYPNAKIIHTVRTPIDNALSIWMTPMSTGAPYIADRDNIVFTYKEYLRLAKHWREVLSPNNYLEVQYEDLVTQPEVTTRKMVEFCDLPWDEACLCPEKNTRTIRTPSFWQVRQPIYKSSLDKWRNYEPWLGPFRELLDLR